MTFTEDAQPLDSEAASINAVTLTDEEIARAIAQSEVVRPAERWQAYQNALALAGMQQWLIERGMDLNEPLTSTVQRPEVAGLLSGVCQLNINGFHLCLIPIGALQGDTVALPRAALELADFVPQIFVLVEVQEEINQVILRGHLRTEQIQVQALTPQADWTYAVPRTWFDPDPDGLLLSIRCLPPTAISAIPLVTSPNVLPVDQVQAALTTLENRLQFMKPIWKLLTWEQAAVILVQPHLGNLAADPIPPADSLQVAVTQAAINAGRWLQGQLDQVAQEWDWLLLPARPQATAMRYTRSPMEQFEDAMTSLAQSGVTIPAQARAAYRDLTWETVSVRLYAITWDLSSATEQTWRLLLLLGPQSGQDLPAGITLSIHDEAQSLDTQTLEVSGPDAYLFSQVEGEWHERFWVTVDLTNGATITLPPFTFSAS